ncbi:hypothetical protein [Nocardia testacea]|uniref:Uncharacterized protein n=1 Tax=Nocardia testacea TaxID=248551 RepID=A0ABW7VP55_9NOCA
MDSVDGDTAAGTPVGSVPYAFGCFVAALVSLIAALITATGYGRNSRVPATVDPGRDGNKGRW